MRIILLLSGILLGVGLLGGWYFFTYGTDHALLSPVAREEEQVQKENPYQKYSFQSLKNRQFTPSPIKLDRPISESENTITQVFYFKSDGKRVSGVMNIPKKAGSYPILIMLRGFVEREIYTPGIGTNRGAEFYADNGFITLSPDFLGYGESDLDSFDSLESRFETYTTVLNLFASLKSLNGGISASYSGVLAEDEKVGVWAHSNGGHIALSVLAISGAKYPTILWAPVSKPFPYSILYFTDEFDDEGKALRRVVADFERENDVFDYSPTRYYEWIQAPLQIHQGTLDDAVPVVWSDELYKRISELEKEVDYFTYDGADHNLAGGAWSIAMRRGLIFLQENLK